MNERSDLDRLSDAWTDELYAAPSSRILGKVLEEMPAEGPGPEDIREIRRILYGLYAILTLHFAQEEESYLALIEERMNSKEGE